MNELEEIRTRIHIIRGQQVMLDFDLAELYGVETSQLKRAVRRNLERFPPDFMFELNNEEFNSLKMSIRCQIGTLSNNQSELPKFAPFAFTEQGVAMLSGVLRSPIAIQVNIRIMRAFVAVRQYLAIQKQENGELEARIKQKFPYIFKQCDDNDGKDVLIIELGTLNAIQKYGGFTETQKVYDQNSMIIFKFLDSMAEEAKQIEDLNRKMKTR